jgi:hypothetical protein
MEMTTDIAGQINLPPVQAGGASASRVQTQEGSNPGCSPFMAILQKILQANDGQAGQAQTAATQAGTNNTLEGISGGLLSRLVSVSGNCLQGREDAEAAQNPIMAILQKIQQTNEGQTAPKDLADKLLCLLQALAGPKSGTESIQESGKSDPGANETEDAQKRSIEQAILLALTQVLQAKSTAIDDNGKNKLAGEESVPDDLNEQDESVEAIAAEILSALLLLEGPNRARWRFREWLYCRVSGRAGQVARIAIG